MSMDNGGPAFPVHKFVPSLWEDESKETLVTYFGLSLRDYFAAAVLPSLLDKHSYVHVAWQAYTIADAMLEERSKSKGAP
jgi:hypothetical protein